MSFIRRRILKKIISLGLCVTLIYNSAIPAFAQEFFYNGKVVDKENFNQIKKGLVREMNLNNLLEYERPVVNDGIAISGQDKFLSAMPQDMLLKIYAPKFSLESHLAKQDPYYAKALKIKYSIMGNPSEQMRNDAQKYFEEGENTNNEQESQTRTEYVKNIETASQKTRNDIEALYQDSLKELEDEAEALLQEGKYNEKNISDWKNKNSERLNEKYQEALKDLEEYKNQQIKEAETVEEEIKQEIANNPDIFFEYVKPLFRELMAIFEEHPDSVKEHIIDITPLIVSLVNQKGEHVYSSTDIKNLLHLYEDFIESEKQKALSGKDVLPSNFCRAKGVCAPLINAFIGVSSLSYAQNNSRYSKLIYDTMNAYHDTAGTIPVVASGFSALLIMKSYQYAEDFLRYRVQKENGFEAEDVIDYINFTKVVDSISNAEGKYLGKSSQFGVYETEDGVIHNLYSDLAQILAEDGTPEALNILRKYGVERCIVQKTSGIQQDTMAKYSVSCRGIKPFIVGALMSGKSGSSDYNLENITEETAEINKAWHSLAKEHFDGDADAMIASHLMSYSMGDLKPEEELNFDTMLYKAFKNHIPEQLLKAKNIIIDTERKESKDSRFTVWKVFMSIGFVGDIVLSLWGIMSLPKIGLSLASFGHSMFNIFKAAKLGVTAKGLMAVGQFAHNFSKAVILNKKVAARIIKMRNFAKNYKNAVSGYISFDAAKYTSAVNTHITNVTYLARRGKRITPGLVDAAKLVSYDSKLNAFKFVNGVNKKGHTKQLQSVLQDIFDSALIETKKEIRMERFFRRTSNHNRLFLKEMETAVRNSPLGIRDQKILIKFFKSSEFEPVAENAVKNVESMIKSSARNFAKKPLTLATFTDVGKKKTPLDVELSIADNMPVFADKVPHSASIIQDGDNFLLKFLKGADETIDFSAFKLTFKDTESFRDLARLSAKLGPDVKLELKFLPKEGNTFWFRNIRNVFITSKEKLFGGKGTVVLVKDGKTIETGITLRTYKKYNGLKLVIDENLDGAINLYKGIDPLYLTTEGSFFLPKYQLGNFVKMTKGANLTKPLNIKLLNGKNKVAALNFTQALSFSAALTGFIGPLSKNYPELKTEQIAVIAIVLPYLLSTLTPLVSPFVKRYGAARVLKTSMALSMGSLIPPMIGGFTGLRGIQAENPFPDKKPDPRWLYPSALMIGIASTLTRGSFSPLIQSIGGGSGTLKAVAFKSISGFLFVIPPMIGAAFDRWSPKYFTYDDGSFYYKDSDKKEKVQKKWLDFSFSYPVMFAVAGMALYTLQKSQFNVRIGTEPGYKIGSAGNFFKEAKFSYKVLLNKNMLPLSLSSALLAGAEASFLYSYATSKSNEYVRNKISEESVVPFIALLGINIPAFIARFNSKPYLKLLGGDNVLGYRNMMTVSLGISGAGAYFMMSNDDPVHFTTGMVLGAIGFSQMTSSILRYGHVKLAVGLKMPTKVVTSWDVSYPTALVGMSGVSYFLGKAADNRIEGIKLENKNDQISLKNTASKESLYVPLSALILGGALSYYGMASNNIFNGSSKLLLPLGLIGESQNPNFKKLVLPKPEMQSNFTAPKPFVQSKNLPDKFPMPEFKLTPMAQE